MAAFLSRSSSTIYDEPTGDTYIGLETFVIELTDSIKRQLAGQQPATGDESGNSIVDTKTVKPGMAMNESAPPREGVGF